ncbi:hypothetical protein Acsp06_36310 [Actinomycetospora sp. NBRC 106375]|nr:hypothetical protein Acsp06_36310 [Actinomycetospora sp. NBRC 106375]
MVGMFSALGLTTIRGCVTGWVISAVVLLAGLALIFTVSPEIGIVLFVLGAIGSVVVTVAMLRVRSNVPPKQQF